MYVERRPISVPDRGSDRMIVEKLIGLEVGLGELGWR